MAYSRGGVVLLLVIRGLSLLLLYLGLYFWSLFCGVALSALSSFADDEILGCFH